MKLNVRTARTCVEVMKLNVRTAGTYNKNAFLNLKRFRIGRKSFVVMIVDRDKENMIELEINVKEERQ